MLEMDDFTPRKTPQKGAFQGLAKPHFNHFHLQTAPPLAKPYFRQMLLNGIAVKLAFSSYKYDRDPSCVALAGSPKRVTTKEVSA
jgi:hypothetical protein